MNLEAGATDGREGGGAGTADGRFGAVEWLLLGLTALIWGAAFLLIDVAVEHLRPAVLALLWVTVGGGTLAFFPSARRPVSPADLPALGLLGATWMAAPFLLFAAAEQSIDSAVAGMLDGATPLFTASVAFAVSPARPAPRSAAGLVLGFVGVVAICLPSLTGAHATASGVAMALLATLCYGVAINAAAPLQQRYGPLAVVLWSELAAALLLTPAALRSLASSTFTLSSVLAAAALGCLGGALANAAFAVLLGRVGPTRASVVVYFPPAVAIGLGALVRHDRVSPISVAGTGVMLCSAWLATRGGRGRLPPGGAEGTTSARADLIRPTQAP